MEKEVDPHFYNSFERLLLETEKLLDEQESEYVESLDFEPLREEARSARELLNNTRPRSSTRRA